MIQTAIFTMIIAVVLQHLGLTEEIAKIVTKICGCYMCCSFWLTLSVMLICGYNILWCLLLSALAAYFSNFIAFIFVILQMLYNTIDKWVRRLRKLNNRS